MARPGHLRAAAVVLVGGHESAGGGGLPPVPEQGGLTHRRARVAAAGRELAQALDAAVGESPADRPVVVLPMTLGRDPRLVSDTARTVGWAVARQHAGRIALASPFGTADHLVGWLRAACRRLNDDDTAVLITAATANPFDDAELYRVAALVRAHGRHRLVEVGLRSVSGTLDEGIERCRRLGAERVAMVPAEFGVRADVTGPLLSVAALARVVAARVETACHRLAEHGDDGIARALAADNLHGFAHSHAGEHAHGHIHPHDHVHAGVG